jgi:hypothetical protein
MIEETKDIRFALRLTESEHRRWHAVQSALGARSLSDAVRATMANQYDHILQLRKLLGKPIGKPRKARKKQ